MRHPPLQAPLLWQTYLGFWITGITAAPWPLPSLCFALLLFVADARLWQWARSALALLCLLAGFTVGCWQLYGSPWPAAAANHADQPPSWLHESTHPPRVCGTVRDMQGLPDNRLRLLLDEVRPAGASTAAATSLPAGTFAPSADQAAPSADQAAASVPPAFAPALQGKVPWTWESPPPAFTLAPPLSGQTVCLTRRPMPAQGFANEGQTDWGLWLAAQGVRWRVWSLGAQGNPQISGQGTVSARWRDALRQDFVAALLPRITDIHHDNADVARQEPRPHMSQGKAILLALLFGDRQYLSQQTLNNFAAATLVHSLALSGQHLTVAGLVGLLCVLAAARVRPGIYLRRPRAVWILLATVPPAMAYLWLGDAPASLLRAAVMLLFLAFYFLQGRPRTTLDVLCAALLCISVASPLSMLDTGLQLSVLCVAVIGMSMPWMRVLAPEPEAKTHRLPDNLPDSLAGNPTGWLQKRQLRRALWALLRIFLVSLGIQVALLPLNMLLFNNMGHWFWLNVFWLPIADMLVLPAAVLGLLLSATGLETPARLILDLAALPCQWLTDCLAWLAAVNVLQPPALLRPHWTALPAFAALLGALALKAGRATLPTTARRLLIAGALLLCIGPFMRTAERLSGHIRLDVLDVGQSQALLLRLPGHVRLLLDGSGSASTRFDPGQALVAPALTYNDAPQLAAVLNTHPDLDHMGGLLHVLRAFTVNQLFENGREGKARWGQQWREARRLHHSRPLARGDSLILGDPAHDLRMEILHPPRTEQDMWQGNDASVVARLTQHGRGLALFLGDAEQPVLHRLLENGDDLRAEVIVAPHHGSQNGFLKEFYAAVQPGLVVASCGFENRYGYPAPCLRAWCDATGVPLLYTGRHGAVRVTWPAQGEGFGVHAVTTGRP